jgi:VCBS repeat protein/Big-like domain-containing protein
MTIRSISVAVAASFLSFATAAFGTCTYGLLNPTAYQAGTQAGDIAVADFNSDTFLDVAIVNRVFGSENAHIIIRFGDGLGGFNDTIGDIDVGEPSQNDIAAGDLNGDGKIDLIIGINWIHLGQPDQVAPHFKLLFGDGAGSFTPTNGPAMFVNNPNHFVLYDFNGDHKLDVAVTQATGSGTGFAIYLNGVNGLTFFNEYVGPGNVVYDPPSFASGDFDGDGKLDLVFASYTSKAYVFFGGGDGTFSPTNGVELNTTVDAYAFELATGDFNEDGRDDIAIANRLKTAPTSLSVFLSNSNRTFAAPVQYGTLSSTDSARAADLDGDGHIDVIVGEGTVELFRGNGDGTFAAQISYDTMGAYVGLAIADLDRDGGPDLVASNFGNGSPGTGKLVVRLNTCGRVRLTLTSSANPENQGTDITTTATAVAPAAVAPTGTITISRDGNPLASTSLATTNTTNATLIDLVPGTYPVVANYSGDSRFIPSTTTLLQVVQVPPFGAPPRLEAISFGGSVALSWVGTQGVDHYEIWRSGGAGFAYLGSSPTTQYTDSAVLANTAYLYEVRGVSPSSTMSGFSPGDPAMTWQFTNETITPGVTAVQLAHLVELRAAVNAVRNVIGMGNATWSDPSPTTVLASHWNELRNAVAEMRASSLLRLRPFAFTDTLSAGVPIRGIHVTELRAAAR